MRSLIIGTSGHIDHGKTALIKALNGFEGDKMTSEIERGITIDLSFSNLRQNDVNIAFIDVPGHENLVKTMISGAYAFDAAMLVVASDDSLMPQSKEHIEILSLLNVKNIILCISKCDLSDTAHQKKAENEVKNYIKNFPNLEILNTFFVSIKDKNSINELRNYLFTLRPKSRQDGLVARYYIDRVFSLKGVGTVVTGSLVDGSIKKNEKLLLLDLDKLVSVRSVQVYEKFVDIATSPNRVALNLSDISTSAISKGQILSKKGFFRGFKEIDCLFIGEISHNKNVVFCAGSRQLSAKCMVLSEKDGQKFVTFKFDKTVFTKFDEAYVILLNSRVVGGGRVLNPVSEPLKKVEKISLLLSLLNRDSKKSFEILASLHKHGFGLISCYQRFGITQEKALEIASSLQDVFVDRENLCIYPNSAVQDLKNIIKFIISKNKFAVFSAHSIALRATWASESLASLALDELEKANLIEKNGSLFIKKGVDLSKIKENLNDKIYNILENSGIAPQAPYNIYDELDIDRQTGDNALKALTSSKKVMRLAHNLFVTTNNLNLAIRKLRDIIKKEGFVNVQNAKNELNLSRKFVICYLEYLDNFKDIVKNENDRVFLINV